MVHADIPTIHYEQVPSAVKVPQILKCNVKSACKSLLRLSEAEVLLPWDIVARPQT